MPDDRTYSPNHDWVMTTEEGVLLGVTEPLLKHLGTLISVELPDSDDEMMVGVPFGAVESEEEIHELMPPGDALILEVNDAVLWDLDALAQDPYGKGWMLRLQLHDPGQLEGRMNAADYETYCRTIWKASSKRGK